MGGPILGRDASPPLELRLKSAVTLQAVADAARGLCEDVVLECSNTGITAQCMDRGNTVLFALSLDADLFASYRCEQTLSLGLSAGRLAQVLHVGKPEDVLDIHATGDGEHLSFCFTDVDASRLCSVDLKLMDLDGECHAIPEHAYEATVLMPARDFRRLCGSLAEFGQDVCIRAKHGDLFELCAGDQVVSTRQQVCHGSTAAVAVQQPCGGNFSLRHLAAFAQATGGRGLVRLALGEGAPLAVQYNLWTGGRLCMYLAPRAEEGA